MFSMKKPVIVTILVILLVLVGYINHYLTQQSIYKSSNDYQKHEEIEMAKGQEFAEKDTIEALSEEEKDNLDIVDSKNGENINDITGKIDSNIEEAISKDENLRNSNYFVEYRLSRDKMRAGLIDRLKEIIEDENTKDDIRTEAQNEIIRLGNTTEKELEIEGLIKAKGFEDALVFLKEDSAKVVVSIDDLTEQDVIKILDIVKSETDLETTQIKIMKKY